MVFVQRFSILIMLALGGKSCFDYLSSKNDPSPPSSLDKQRQELWEVCITTGPKSDDTILHILSSSQDLSTLLLAGDPRSSKYPVPFRDVLFHCWGQMIKGCPCRALENAFQRIRRIEQQELISLVKDHSKEEGAVTLMLELAVKLDYMEPYKWLMEQLTTTLVHENLSLFQKLLVVWNGRGPLRDHEGWSLYDYAVNLANKGHAELFKRINSVMPKIPLSVMSNISAWHAKAIETGWRPVNYSNGSSSFQINGVTFLIFATGENKLLEAWVRFISTDMTLLRAIAYRLRYLQDPKKLNIQEIQVELVPGGTGVGVNSGNTNVFNAAITILVPPKPPEESGRNDLLRIIFHEFTHAIDVWNFYKNPLGTILSLKKVIHLVQRILETALPVASDDFKYLLSRFMDLAPVNNASELKAILDKADNLINHMERHRSRLEPLLIEVVQMSFDTREHLSFEELPPGELKTILKNFDICFLLQTEAHARIGELIAIVKSPRQLKKDLQRLLYAPSSHETPSKQLLPQSSRPFEKNMQKRVEQGKKSPQPG